MRLLGWIFQPGYILFFAIITALYLYRHEVLPEHIYSAKSGALIEQIEQAVITIEADRLRYGTQHSVAAEIVANSDSQPPPAQREGSVQVVGSDLSTVDAAPFEPLPEVVREPAVPAASEGDSAPPVDVAEKEIKPERPTLAALWYAARQAAWIGDYPLAIERYKIMTKSYPDSADGFGELGNIYYTLGDSAGAVAAYRQALQRYQATGRHGSSIPLLRIINRIQQGPMQ